MRKKPAGQILPRYFVGKPSQTADVKSGSVCMQLTDFSTGVLRKSGFRLRTQTKTKEEKNNEHSCAPNPRLLQQPVTVTEKQVCGRNNEERLLPSPYFVCHCIVAVVVTYVLWQWKRCLSSLIQIDR